MPWVVPHWDLYVQPVLDPRGAHVKPIASVCGTDRVFPDLPAWSGGSSTGE